MSEHTDATEDRDDDRPALDPADDGNGDDEEPSDDDD
jgi:hypothetical protein